MLLKSTITLVVVMCTLMSGTMADTPANCTYEDIRGLWVFHEGPRGNDKTVNCSAKGNINQFYVSVSSQSNKTQFNLVNITNAFFVRLDFPNMASDFDGNIGYWTIIYNQGFEVVINNRKYFAFSLYKQSGDNVTSYCDHTFYGWSHEMGVNPGKSQRVTIKKGVIILICLFQVTGRVILERELTSNLSNPSRI